jgi:hypothetical protein
MNHFKSGAILATVVGVCSSSVKADITSAPTMKDVQAKIMAVLQTHKPEDVLAAFDIDMTLLLFEHPAVYYPALKKYAHIYNNILGKLPSLQKDVANTLLVHNIPLRLVEEDTPQMIKDLQWQGIRVIAFTATLTGQLSNAGDKTIALRCEQLQNEGLDFTQTFQDFMDCITFTNFSQYARSYPMFYKGVLSSNGEGSISKGHTMTAFLAFIGKDYEQKTGKTGFFPKVVVLVDDRKKHLTDVETSLKAYDPSIQFIGIEYQGAFSYAPQDISQEDFQKFWEDMAEQAKAEVF